MPLIWRRRGPHKFGFLALHFLFGSTRMLTAEDYMRRRLRSDPRRGTWVNPGLCEFGRVVCSRGRVPLTAHRDAPGANTV